MFRMVAVFRIHKFLGPHDLDLLVRGPGPDPDPDPSILDFYCFVTSL